MQNQKNSDLFLKKFKENVSHNMNKIKEKYIFLTNNIDNKVQNIKNNNIIVKEKAKKDNEKLKTENLLLKQDNQKLREDLEDAKTRHQNKLKVLGALTGFHDYDTLNQLIDEEDFIKEKEENLNELIWLKSFLSEIKYGDFEEKILMNID
jgi:hypothetical protein